MRVYPFRLISGSSQGIYEDNLTSALCSQGVDIVNDVEEADVIHQFDTNLIASHFNGVRTLIRATRLDTPLVVAMDDLFFINKPQFTRRPFLYPINVNLHKLIIKASDAVLTFSESAATNIHKNSSSSKVHVVEHGISDSFRSKNLAHNEYVLHVGHAAPYKYPEAIRYVAEHCEFTFKIAGNGWENFLPASIKRRSNIEIIGFVPRDEIKELYKNAKVFYFPTRCESFGLPLLEALATSTPVVTTDAYAVPEIVGDVGIINSIHDVETQYQEIVKLVQDDYRRDNIAKQSYERALHFSWERSAQKTIDVYRQLITDII